MHQNTPWGISFFTKRYKVLLEEYAKGELFESPRIIAGEIGQVSLVFNRFDAQKLRHIYTHGEKSYSIEKNGRLAIDSSISFWQKGFFEIMVILRTTKKIEEDQLVFNLWVKDKEPVFSTFLEIKPYGEFASVFLGGFTWWTSLTNSNCIQRLQLPIDIKTLSGIQASFARVPRLYQKQQKDEFIYLEEEEE